MQRSNFGNVTPAGPAAALPTAAGGSDWPSTAELVGALKRRVVLATLLGLLVGAAAAAAAWLALPTGKHKVRALVQVKPLTDVQGRPYAENFSDYKQTQLRLVSTRNVINMALADAEAARQPMVVAAPDRAQLLEDLIKVSWEAPSLMAISMSGDDHKQLEVLVRAVVASYLESSKSDDIKEGTQRRKRLEDLLQSLDDRIKARVEGIRKLQSVTGAGSDPATNAALMAAATQDLNRLQGDVYGEEKTIRELEVSLLRHRQNLAAVDQAPLTAEDVEAATAGDPRVQEKAAVKAALEKQEQAVLAQFDLSSPTVTRVRADLRRAEAELKATVEALRPGVEKAARAARKRAVETQLRADTEALEMRRQIVDRMNAVARTKAQQIKDLRQGGSEVKFEDDDLRPLQEQRNVIRQELARIQDRDRGDVRIQLKEDAVAILNQNLRKKVLAAAAAFVVGGLLVALAVGLVEWRSRRVDSVDQVVTDLGVRVIGTIPAFPSRQALTSGDAGRGQSWRFALNESVNSTRTMVLHAARAGDMQVLMVTSAMQGEGKTSLASQLATSMATAGLKTLLLDCDLRNPSMHKLFDTDLTPGCSEVLCQEVDLSDAVHPTGVPGLWLIPAGQCSNRVVAALAQGQPLEALFNRLRGQFDFVVVDSCPVLPVADTLLVGQHVDGVLLSILQDTSQLPKVRTTADRLTQLNIPLLGAVVSGIRQDVHAYGYNYVKQLPA